MSSPPRAWQRCRPLWFRMPHQLRILWILAALALGPLQRRWRPDPGRLRALLLVRDLHTPLPALVDGLLAQGLRAEHIHLLDSGSSAPACLATLASLQQRGCQWLRLPAEVQRFGPYAAWLSPALQSLIRSWRYPYLLSDSDLALPAALPEDWLAQLFNTLNRHRGVPKVALPLEISDITVANHAEIRAHERAISAHPAYRALSGLLLRSCPGATLCPTDTTLSLYRPGKFFTTLSIRLPQPYSLRHLPWYHMFCDSAEYAYYQSHKLALFGEWSTSPTVPEPEPAH